MTFEQADQLTDRILNFLWDCGGCYTRNRVGDLQETILTALATRQFILRISQGRILYFACWFYTDEEPEEGEPFPRPANPTIGKNLYVEEVASSGGYGKEIIRRIIQQAIKPRNLNKTFWHKPHRDGQLYSNTRRTRRRNGQ